MFIDTHCHLDFKVFDKNRKDLINKCGDLKIKHFINPATQRASWDSLIALNYSGEFFRTAFGQKVDVKLSKTFSILTLPKYTSAGVLYPKL